MHIDIAIIGGGIVGLQLARLIEKNFSNERFVIFEKNHFLGEESSSRNSGVLHAGLYYPTGSLKHKLCIQGLQEWPKIAQELSIPINNCGKYLVATTQNEVDALIKLYNNAKGNGVKNLEWIDDPRDLSLPVNSIQKCFFSSSTSIIDQSKAISSLKNDLYKKNVMVSIHDKVQNITYKNKKFIIESDREKITSNILVNSAGLGAIKLREQLGLKNIELYPIKGNYLKYTKTYYNSHLIYPIPPAHAQGLGVHTSFDTEGNVKFGPNTEEISEIDYNINKNLVENMWPSINKVFKNVEKEFLQLDYCGIRSKIILNKKLYPDFLIESYESIPGYIEALGIESPGFTASPAIAKTILKMVTKYLN